MAQKSLRDKIYEKTRENITRGYLAPGERLVEDRLAKEFKASRSPVREALRLLESEGLIHFERNKGITVAKLSIKQVEEIYEMRWLLESHAAGKTAEKITKKDIAQLKKMQKDCIQAAKDVNLDGWLKGNASFHGLFYKRCDNSNLIQVIENLRRKVHRYHFVTVSVPWHFDTYLAHHEEMIKGCENKDGEVVEKYMKLHLETMKTALINQLKNRGVVF